MFCVQQYDWTSPWLVFHRMTGLVVGLCSSVGLDYSMAVFISMAGLVLVCVHQYDWTSRGLCSSV